MSNVDWMSIRIFNTSYKGHEVEITIRDKWAQLWIDGVFSGHGLDVEAKGGRNDKLAKRELAAAEVAVHALKVEALAIIDQELV